jgi:hypothetical protein
MPLLRKKWEDLSERSQRNEHYGKEEFEAFQDELEQTIEAAMARMSADEFTKYIESMREAGVEWID